MKLTDTQLVILSAAAQREDRTALPVPTSLKLRGAAADKVLDGLRQKGFLLEQPAGRGAATWRGSEAGEQTTLVITDPGLRAIGILATEPIEASPDRTRAEDRVAKPAPRSGTKLGKVIAMLRGKKGASVPDIASATGWQPHTIRAALTGLRKRGFTVSREKIRGASVYRVARG